MINYFDFYGLPVKFSMDERLLKSLYHQKLKQHHPDFFAHNETEHKEALGQSSLNNEAFLILNDVYSRYRHVLDLNGIVPSERLPAAFLMEMMDVNESIELLQQNGNSGSIDEITAGIKDMESNLNQTLSETVQQLESTSSFAVEHLKRLDELLLMHKYILRLKETISNIAAP